MSSDIRTIIKDSLFTGLISLALFGPIVGLKTFSKGAGLICYPSLDACNFFSISLYYWTFFNWFKLT